MRDNDWMVLLVAVCLTLLVGAFAWGRSIATEQGKTTWSTACERLGGIPKDGICYETATTIIPKGVVDAEVEASR